MAGKGRVFKRGSKWWIAYYINAKEYRESGGSTKQEAHTLLAKRVLAGHAPIHLTVATLLDGVLRDYEANKRKSVGSTHTHIKRVHESLGFMEADKVNSSVLRAYRDERLANGAAAATINREFAALRRGFNLREDVYCPKFPMLHESNARQGFFEYEEVERVTKRLPDHLKPVVWFGFYTGWRKGEILSLAWAQVDLADRLIRLHPDHAKNGHGRLMALEGDLWVVIRERHADRQCQLVFHRDGQAIRELRPYWQNACKAEGLEGKFFHDLRRTAVRNLVRAGVPEKVAMEISGHKTRTVFDRYNIVNEADIRQAMRRVT